MNPTTDNPLDNRSVILRLLKNNLRSMGIACGLYLAIIVFVVGLLLILFILFSEEKSSLEWLTGLLVINSYPFFLLILGIVYAQMLDFMLSAGVTRMQFSWALLFSALVIILALALLSSIINAFSGWTGILAQVAGFTSALFEFLLGWILGLAFLVRRGKTIFFAILGAVIALNVAGFPLVIQGQRVMLFEDPLYTLVITGSLSLVLLVLTQILTRRTAIRC